MNVQNATPEQVRNHFLGWQCRIRQIAMRRDGGRPSSGMRPRVVRADGTELSAGIVTLIVPEDPAESTDFFRHQVRRTSDPRQIFERGLDYLRSTHFQEASRFSDRLTATFAPVSALAASLVDAGECILEFSQYSQSYRMICDVERLTDSDPAREATVWHNRLFNPQLPNDIHVLAFSPDWRSVQADPAP